MTTAIEDSSRTARPPDAFAFGRNWQRYVDAYLDPERVQIAMRSLNELIEEDLAGRTFVDVGAGSGLFSLCAYRAGAAHVLSFDVDPDSVSCCCELRRREGSPDTWNVCEGSVLDSGFVASLEQADVVYSWGVLHHTGDMYTAIRQAARLVKPGGMFVIAIYNKATRRFLDSDRWLGIKRKYNRSNRVTQMVMEASFMGYWAARQVAARQNPVRVAREYKKNRGMALKTDFVDWLGGYPYEYATADEIVSFCRDDLGLEVVKVLSGPPTGTGNNQFVFRRPASIRDAA
jgi:2-polyprenyl-6-hydroxyphenyl methylase/3-demethylubiquinone-9 3-methyltransferase